MMSECKLCLQQKELRKSHIIPTFVGKYLKETSVTGKLRKGKSVNKRVQDIHKEYLYCKECEELMSVEEKYFAENYFKPIHYNGILNFKYDYHLRKYFTIQNYRTLVSFGSLKEYRPSFIKVINKSKEYFRKLILLNAKNQTKYSNHLFISSLMENIEEDSLKKNKGINRYFLRSIDAGVIDGPNHLFVFTKSCRMLMITFLVPSKPKYLKDTKIYYNGATQEIQTWDFPGLSHFFFNRADQTYKKYETMSEKQKEIIHEDFLKMGNTYNKDISELIDITDDNIN